MSVSILIGGLLLLLWVSALAALIKLQTTVTIQQKLD
jgi:hypothetical protein